MGLGTPSLTACSLLPTDFKSLSDKMIASLRCPILYSRFPESLARSTGPSFVLIVQFESPRHWPEGVLAQLFVQICRKANSSFAQTAEGKLYWISVIGPHWRYGIKEDDGQLELSPLIPWHHTTHDDASFDDLQTLAGLVGALY